MVGTDGILYWGVVGIGFFFASLFVAFLGRPLLADVPVLVGSPPEDFLEGVPFTPGSPVASALEALVLGALVPRFSLLGFGVGFEPSGGNDAFEDEKRR